MDKSKYRGLAGRKLSGKLGENSLSWKDRRTWRQAKLKPQLTVSVQIVTVHILLYKILLMLYLI